MEKDRKDAALVEERDREAQETRGMYQQDSRVLVLLTRRNSIPTAGKGQKVSLLLRDVATSLPLRDVATSLPCTGAEAEGDTEAAAAAEKAEKRRQSSLLMAKRIASKAQADIQIRRDRDAAEALKKEQKSQVGCHLHITACELLVENVMII